MAHRFFSDDPIQGDRISLVDAEARHLSQVMRKQVGDQVTVFDGSGYEFQATITNVGRRLVELAVDTRVKRDRELSYELTVAVALPKGDRQTWMVQKLVELGVSRLIPLVTERGVVMPTRKSLDRLERHVIEASKQCERNVLLKIGEPARIGGLSEVLPGNCIRLVAHVTAKTERQVDPVGQDVCFAVGPEGGFTDREVADLIDGGWQSLQLGDRILRVETAAVGLASWWGISTCVTDSK